MPNRPLEDKISLPAKTQPVRPSLVHYLVGPNVRWSVLGLVWSVWSGLWASFACVTHDAIVCDFVYVFIVFSSCSELVLLKT